MAWNITGRESWRTWVTPRPARDTPRHRWFLFPHSFSGHLVEALAEEWALTDEDRLLDPFAGSGTTLLAAKALGIPSVGYDISPLAVLACNTKVRNFSESVLKGRWQLLEQALCDGPGTTQMREYPQLVRSALPEGRLEALDSLWSTVKDMDWPIEDKEFFQLAIVAIVPQLSHAIADGGWLRWRNSGRTADCAVSLFQKQVELMLSDLNPETALPETSAEANVADARSLPTSGGYFSAAISSPPYPNRHDYSRIFGVELMFAFHDWEANRALRYQSFHSHPEAHPRRDKAEEYRPPERLYESVERCADGRLKRMLEGYFLDMYLSLREVVRVCRSGSRVAVVVGNARYSGRVVLVDEFTAEVGQQAGLRCEEIRAVRWRGNSAQQMGKFGREAARESVVIFTRP